MRTAFSGRWPTTVFASGRASARVPTRHAKMRAPRFSPDITSETRAASPVRRRPAAVAPECSSRSGARAMLTGSSSGFPDTRRKRIPSGYSGLYRDFVPIVEEHERPVACLKHRRFIRNPTSSGSHGQRLRKHCRRVPDPAKTYANAWRVVSTRQRLSVAGRNGYIDIHGVGGNPVHRAFFAPKRSADDANRGAVVVRDERDIGRLHFLITGRGHLERGGEVRPKLKAMHPPLRIALGHFLMDNPAARRHPLDVTGVDGARLPMLSPCSTVPART